jgi:hypothetical protein
MENSAATTTATAIIPIFKSFFKFSSKKLHSANKPSSVCLTEYTIAGPMSISQ